MNPGMLNKKITIQKLTKVKSENDFDDEDWIDFKKVWASVNNLFGREFWEAKSVKEENTIEFVIRYSQGLSDLDSKKFRIHWNNKVHNITFVDNVKYENKYLKIKAIEVN